MGLAATEPLLDNGDSRSSCDYNGSESDDPEAVLFDADQQLTDDGTVAPLISLRRLISRGGRGEDAGHGGPYSPNPARDLNPPLPVYVVIHRIRRLVVAAIDDSYTLEELRAPRLDRLVVRPLVDRLYNPNDPATGRFPTRFFPALP